MTRSPTGPSLDPDQAVDNIAPYYEDDLVTLYQGDVLDVLPHLSGIDLVVTDPPYFQPAQHYVPMRGERPIRTLGDTSILEYSFKAWAAALEQATTDDASLYVFCDGQSYPITYRAFYSLGRVRPLVWDKVTSFNGYTWRHQHELIAWVERHEADRVPTGDGDILRCRAVKKDDRIHPAEKPVSLLRELIGKHTDATTTVLDCFAGSGSTLIAAKSLGLRAVGIEIEELYCERAAARLAGTQVDAMPDQDSLDFGGAA